MHPISQDASYKPKSIRYSNETAIYLGMFRGVWGHCLTDNIKRLWFLKSELYQKHFRGCPLVYIPMWDFDLDTKVPTFRELIEILDIDPNNLYPVIDEAIQYKNLIIPEKSFHFYNYYTNEYKETIDIIRNFALKNLKQLPFKKVYLFHGRNQIGEDRIAKYFQSKGYATIQPEKFSFKEQLNIFINCESFASLIGSSSHNMIFLKDHSEVILIPRAFYITGYQEALNNVHDLNIVYVDSSLSVFANNDFPWGGPFFYFLSKNLLRYFGDIDEENFEYSYSDFKNFLVYLKASIQRGFKIAPKIKEYYGEYYESFLHKLKQQRNLLASEGVIIN